MRIIVFAFQRRNGPVGKWGGEAKFSRLYLCFTATRKTHIKHHERIKRNLQKYENAWHILKKSTDRLHDRNAWPLLRGDFFFIFKVLNDHADFRCPGHLLQYIKFGCGAVRVLHDVELGSISTKVHKDFNFAKLKCDKRCLLA